MEINWEELKQKMAKELEEALSSLFQKAFEETEGILNQAKSRAEEAVKNYSDKLTEEYIKNLVDESVKNTIEEQRKQVDQIITEKTDEISKEIEKFKSDLISSFESRIKEFESQLDQHVKEALDPGKIKENLDDRIKRFIEEETHIFEEELKKLSQEVLDKNQKDIKKNVEKTLKALYESEDGIKKIILELLKNQSEYIADQLKEKISEIVATSSKELLLQSPLSERIAEVVGFEMKKYFKEIEELKSALEVLEVKLKILAESPSAVMEKEEKIPETTESEIPSIDLFPKDEGVVEEIEVKESVEETEQSQNVENIPSTNSNKETEEVVEVIEKTERKTLKLETPISITYLGHAAFVIESKGIKILTDPYKHLALNNSIKYKPVDVEADFVTVSHAHMDQGAWKEIPGNPKLVEVEGEKIFSEYPFLRFKGIHTFHDNAEGNVRGSNMVFNIEISGVRITHLGALGHILNKEQIREIGRPVDILMIPVGGYDTLPIKDAWEVVYQLDPLVVIPMRFKTDACDLPLAEVDAFTSLAKCPVKLLESHITINELPTSMEVWVLKPSKLP